ncbi:DUF427 domain-containing protein [Nocardia inohanensis]|uniref:DUF427 domain-containing protein n=1 Tax=Nocardia inohanensis TaxID=209246 RepID=UPI00082B5073|nr:DUF427 domain-containing protein [Nocardia inohanensis]
MTERPVLQPGSDHPLVFEANPGRVTVRVNGRTIADTKRAVTVRESNYPAVQYIPIEDVDRSLLVPSSTTSYCPYKGDASYYGVSVDGERREDVAWVYERPHPASDRIAGHLAFYADRVDEING